MRPQYGLGSFCGLRSGCPRNFNISCASSKSFFEMIGSCFPSWISPPYLNSPMEKGLERIKDALVLEILFPVLVVTPDFAKKADTSSSRIFPFAYFSKAKRTMQDFFFPTTIVFVRESLRYPTGAWLGNMPMRTFWRSPRFVFSEREST